MDRWDVASVGLRPAALSVAGRGKRRACVLRLDDEPPGTRDAERRKHHRSASACRLMSDERPRHHRVRRAAWRHNTKPTVMCSPLCRCAAARDLLRRRIDTATSPTSAVSAMQFNRRRSEYQFRRPCPAAGHRGRSLRQLATQVDCSRMGRVVGSVCLFSTRYLKKTDEARITRLDTNAPP